MKVEDNITNEYLKFTFLSFVLYGHSSRLFHNQCICFVTACAIFPPSVFGIVCGYFGALNTRLKCYGALFSFFLMSGSKMTMQRQRKIVTVN